MGLQESDTTERDEKGTTEDKMVGWHDRLNRREFG